MTKTEIISYISQPAQIGEKESERLSQLAERFPFSQTIQVLHARGLHNVKSIDYLGKLKLAAALTADRKVLYNFIMQQELLEKIHHVVQELEKESHPVTAELKTENENPGKEKEEENIDEIIEKKVKELIGDKMHRVDHIEELVDKQVKATMEPLLSDDPKEEGIAEEKPEIPKKEPVADKYSEFEKQILWEAVNATIQHESLTNEEKPLLSENEEAKEKGTFNWDTRHSFFNWLVPVKPEEKAVNDPLQKFEKNKPEKEDVAALVDKFIKNDPKITPQKTEFFTPGNVAKLSIIDNEAFVTETLAKIYEKQGYYQKAMKVYEKLSLKIPEKSAYFASRLKELETLLKNSKNK